MKNHSRQTPALKTLGKGVLPTATPPQAAAQARQLLRVEFIEPCRAEDSPRQLNLELEQRLAQCAAELIQANEILNGEIAKRQQAETMLQQQREWFRVTLASIGDGVLASDLEGRVTFLNPVAATLTGWKPEEALGQPIRGVFPTVDASTYEPGENLVERVLRDKRTVAFANHTLLITKDGRFLSIEDRAAPILNGDGSVLGVTLVFHEAIEKRRRLDDLEQRVRERTAELAQNNQNLRMISECHQILSHATNEAQLCQEIALLLSQNRDFQLGWIGLVEHDHAKSIRPVAAFGFPEGCLEPVGVLNHNASGDTPQGAAVRSGMPQTVNDCLADSRSSPCQEPASQLNFRSVIALPLMNQGQALGVLSLYAKKPQAFGRKDISPWKRLADDLAIGIIRLRTQAERNELLLTSGAQAEQLHALAIDLTLAEQRERQRLAQYLHDNLQQFLVAASFSEEFLRKQFRSEALQKEFHNLRDILKEATTCCRTLTYEICPPTQYEDGLLAALKWLSQWMRQRYGLEVAILTDLNQLALDQHYYILLYQAVRELLFNAVKHAGVNRAQVSIRQVPENQVEVMVRDEGKGFNPAQLQIGRSRTGGLGLAGIHKRIKLLHGTMEIQSAPNQGSRFTIRVPTQLVA